MDGKQNEGEKACTDAFKSGNKSVSEQLLSDIQPALVRTQFKFVRSVATMVSLLHLAAFWGWKDIAVLLVTKFNCVANWRDHKGNLPLHYAAYNGKLDVVKYLTAKLLCNPMDRNEQGQTPLYFACSNGHLSVVQYLIDELHCYPVCDVYGETMLHISCRHEHLNICQYFINEVHYNPVHGNNSGNTPLHCACSDGHLDIAHFLISEAHCNPSCENKGGNTPLHYACSSGHFKITQYLISKAHCNPSCRNNVGSIPLHDACSNGHLNIVQYLISEAHCRPFSKNNRGSTPLHYACSSGQQTIAQYLINKANCNPSCKDNSGNTPLHCACSNGHLNVVQYLISEAHCNPADKNEESFTPLHLACTGSHVNIVQYLLSTGLVNPLAEDKHGHTPLYCATGKYDILKLFQPFTDCKRNFPVHSFTKLILVGDSGVGKTTMAQVITFLLTSSSNPASYYSVTDVERFTAGIIPHPIESKLGNFVIYDFAGQQEYYASHAAILEQVMRKSAALFLCMINLSESNESICQSLQYWLRFIDNACSTTKGTSHVAVVGSHADQVASSKQMEGKSLLLQAIAVRRLKRQEYVGYITIDCLNTDTSTSYKLTSMLTNSNKAIAASQPVISYYSHVLYAFLRTKLTGVICCTLQELTSLISKENDSFLPNDTSILTDLLTTLNDKGLILFILRPEPVSSWVIMKTDVLLNEINGTLFAPRHFKEYLDIASNTGIVPATNLQKAFPQHNLEMLVGFLKSLEFCQQVDPSILQYTNLQTTPLHSTGDLLFFPGLIESERPDYFFKRGTLQFGWCLGCVEPYDFFSSRFLHVLLLSVAYKFPLTSQFKPSPSLSGLQRKCVVWRNGISWNNDDDITTVIELLSNNRWVLLAMSCDGTCPVNEAKLRSSLISLVHHIKQEHCQRLEVSEYLISTNHVKQYPFIDLPDSDLFHIHDVAQSILRRKAAVRSYKDSSGRLSTKSLPFEPYHLLSTSSVRQLLDPNMASQPVPKLVLQEVQTLYNKPQERPQFCRQLREFVDCLSIFSGRNPLVSKYNCIIINHVRS